MKKLSLLIMQSLLWGAFAFLPSAASAQDDPKGQFERDWYAACYTQKDQAKCLAMSKELCGKYSDSTYCKSATAIVKQDELTKAWEAFQAALKDYYSGPPDVAKLEKLFSTGDAFLQIQPNYPDVVAQQALAGSQAALPEIYKNLDKVKAYAEKALALFEPANTINKEQMDQARWTQFRELIMANQNQFLGFYFSQPSENPRDAQKALEYLGKSTSVKSASGIGWKDPTNYWIRSTVNNLEYVKLSKEYAALPDDQKTGDAGKALLKRIGSAVDKLIPDYARVVVTATKPEYKSYLDAANQSFKSLWDFRTGKPEAGAEYVKNYAADPTIADVPIPAKPEEAAPPAGPPTSGPAVKLSGGSGAAPGAAANGTKATTTKGKAKAGPKKKRR
jgi:hypothetical protein